MKIYNGYKRLNENIILDMDNMVVYTVLIGIISLIVLVAFIYTFKKKRIILSNN